MLKGKKKRNGNFNNRFKSIDRHTSVFIISLFVFLFITVKLVFLQILDHDYYDESSKSKSHKLVEIAAPRGNIYDARGQEFATSVQSYVLTYTDTEDNAKVFYETMEQVFDILNKQGEKINDDFPIKLNDAKDGVKFEFNAQDDEGRKTLENLFKNDISLGDKFAKELFDKSYSDLNESERSSVREKNLEMSAEDTYKYLVESLGVPAKYPLELQRKFVVLKNAIKMQSYSGFKPVSIASNLKKDTAMIFTEKLNLLPGVAIDQITQRVYPQKELGSSFLGYISKISEEKYKEQGYDLSSDYRGVSGVEAAFEDRLRGSKGAKIVEVNRSGKPISELAKREPYPGQNIYLTIDMNLQKKAEESLNDVMKSLRTLSGNGSQNATRGATVALDVNTGSVLAMASLPGFDPNDFANPAGIPTEKRNQYFFGTGANDYENYAKAKGWDKDYVSIGGKSYNKMELMFPKDSSGRRVDIYDYFPKPLLNYATSSIEPPGSIFKPFTALAGLSEGVITPGTIVNDTGWYHDGEGYDQSFLASDAANGNVNLSSAMEVSSNPYFMETSKRLVEKYNDSSALKSAGINNKFDIIGKYVWPLGLGVDPTDENPKDYTGIEISENFGQVFNFTSMKNKTYTLVLDKLLSTLNSGTYTNKAKKYNFQKVDLYKNDNDTSDVAKLKEEIKNNLKDILSADYSQGEKQDDIIKVKIKKQLQDLIKADPKYSDVTFKDKGGQTGEGDIGDILEVIDIIFYWDGYKPMASKFNIYNASIGQGDSNFTPLQMASAFATLLNGGTRYKVHLLDKATDSDGNLVYQTQPEVLDKVEINQEYLEDIKDGMYDVINGPKGKNSGGLPFKGLNVTTGGKTGSATFLEGGLQEQLGRNAFAWFVNFAPYDKPEIVVVTVIFDGHYGRYAGPVNKAVTEEYFRLKSITPQN
ncbi:MAG: penicillin-binding transpeptidase domain-containing protein [Clostridiaceae bacterium]